jgi:4-alpha-glucanotransferase
MNTPSLSDGNWGWRLTPGLLTKQLVGKLAAMSTVSDRFPQTSSADQQSHREVLEEFAA